MLSRTHVAETAARLFDAAGDLALPAVLTRSTPGAYDPTAGTPDAPAVSQSNCKILPDRSTRPRFALDGLDVAEGEEALWLHGSSFAPQPGDSLTVAGAARVVRGVRNLMEANALFLVVCQ